MLPALDDLQHRYATACDLCQRVDRDAITDALTRWAREIGAPAEMRVRFVSSMKGAASAASA
ncbi:hypothetical protein, partial [Hyphomicrobium sp.]|uniref:hypothetical protein n=1 Tax=Hyphomicrobium sp. TaxID=82 RepID=UPI0025BE149A